MKQLLALLFVLSAAWALTCELGGTSLPTCQFSLSYEANNCTKPVLITTVTSGGEELNIEDGSANNVQLAFDRTFVEASGTSTGFAIGYGVAPFELNVTASGIVVKEDVRTLTPACNCLVTISGGLATFTPQTGKISHTATASSTCADVANANKMVALVVGSKVLESKLIVGGATINYNSTNVYEGEQVKGAKLWVIVWSGSTYSAETFSIAPFSDFALKLGAPEQVTAGQPFVLNVNVTNLGNEARSYTIVPKVPFGWTAAQTSTGQILPGKSSIIPLNIGTPQSFVEELVSVNVTDQTGLSHVKEITIRSYKEFKVAVEAYPYPKVSVGSQFATSVLLNSTGTSGSMVAFYLATDPYVKIDDRLEIVELQPGVKSLKVIRTLGDTCSLNKEGTTKALALRDGEALAELALLITPQEKDFELGLLANKMDVVKTAVKALPAGKELELAAKELRVYSNIIKGGDRDLIEDQKAVVVSELNTLTKTLEDDRTDVLDGTCVVQSVKLTLRGYSQEGYFFNTSAPITIGAGNAIELFWMDEVNSPITSVIVPQGEAVDVKLSITNKLNETRTFTLAAAQSPLTVALDTKSLEIAGGATEFVDATVTANSKLPLGTYEVLVQASSGPYVETKGLDVNVGNFGIDVRVSDTPYPAEPGKQTPIKITIRNLGKTVDTYTTELSGETWVSTPAKITVEAGKTADLILTAEPPADVQKNKEYAFDLTLTSQASADVKKTISFAVKATVDRSSLQSRLDSIKTQSDELKARCAKYDPYIVDQSTRQAQLLITQLSDQEASRKLDDAQAALIAGEDVCQPADNTTLYIFGGLVVLVVVVGLYLRTRPKSPINYNQPFDYNKFKGGPR